MIFNVEPPLDTLLVFKIFHYRKLQKSKWKLQTMIATFSLCTGDTFLPDASTLKFSFFYLIFFLHLHSSPNGESLHPSNLLSPLSFSFFCLHIVPSNASETLQTILTVYFFLKYYICYIHNIAEYVFSVSTHTAVRHFKFFVYCQFITLIFLISEVA